MHWTPEFEGVLRETEIGEHSTRDYVDVFFLTV